MGLLVEEVGSHAFLGYDIHALGAYLHLHPLPYGRHHGGLQRLVAVGLGGGNPVAEAAGVGFKLRGDEGVDLEAFRLLFLFWNAGEDDAHGVEVINLVKLHPFALHFLPAAVHRLDTCLDGVFVAVGIKHLAYFVCDAALQLVLGAHILVDECGYLVVLVWVGVFHHQLFKFCFDGVEPQPVCQRDV